VPQTAVTTECDAFGASVVMTLVLLFCRRGRRARQADEIAGG
jgi:hypothetical protein